MQTTAKISFEIELALMGNVSAYAPATYDDPAEGGEIEEFDIEDIGIVERVPAPEHERVSHPHGVWKTTSILDGVDMKSPAIRKLLDNLIALREREITDALAEASTEAYYDHDDYD